LCFQSIEFPLSGNFGSSIILSVVRYCFQSIEFPLSGNPHQISDGFDSVI
jgi:hypothetical protein